MVAIFILESFKLLA